MEVIVDTSKNQGGMPSMYIKLGSIGFSRYVNVSTYRNKVHWHCVTIKPHKGRHHLVYVASSYNDMILVKNVVIDIMWFSIVLVFVGGQVNHQPPPYAHHLLSVCDVCDHHLLCPYQRPSCHTQKQVRVLLRGNTVVSSGNLMTMNILKWNHCEILKLKYWF